MMGEAREHEMTTVLLVEDNEMNRDALSRRLRRSGFTVALALDGQQAIEMVHTEAPALILMDMSLPIKDGWTATRELKTDPDTQTIPIIALTAHVSADDRERALEAGADDYDTKPISMQRLLGKIEALLGK